LLLGVGCINYPQVLFKIKECDLIIAASISKQFRFRKLEKKKRAFSKETCYTASFFFFFMLEKKARLSIL